jgi:hypothetical protein
MMQLVLAAVLPVLLLVIRPRVFGTLVATIGATWTVSTVALCWFETDDIGLFLMFLIVLLPALAVTMATVVAVASAPLPRRVFAAGFLATCGWWLGMLLLYFSGSFAASEFWACAWVIALPAVTAGTGAAFGATSDT